MMTVNILGIQTSAQSFDEALEKLTDWSQDGEQKRYVSTCPVYTVMMGYERADVREALNAADMVAADGMPIAWLQRIYAPPPVQRVYGPDIMLELCRRTEKLDVSHYFWGGKPTVVEQLSRFLKSEFPDLDTVGYHSPPFSPLPEEPDLEMVKAINDKNPDVVWVGLGSPKQDLWMHMYRPLLNAKLLIAVGAAFDFLTNNVAQAPLWMRQSGLEWLFRLSQEPRRLAKRYLVYNTKFLYCMVTQQYKYTQPNRSQLLK